MYYTNSIYFLFKVHICLPLPSCTTLGDMGIASLSSMHLSLQLRPLAHMAMGHWIC